MADFSCPSCGHDDMVQKVTAIVSGGTTSQKGHAFGAAGDSPVHGVISATASTELAQRLARLRPTTGPKEESLGMTCGLALGCGLVVAIGLFVAAGGSYLAGLGMVLFAGMFLVAGIWDMLDRRRPDERAKRSAAYEEQVAQYNAAIRRWQQLYYCHRCDGTFVPGDAKVTPLP